MRVVRWFSIIVLGVLLASFLIRLTSGRVEAITYSQFVHLVKEGRLVSSASKPVTFSGNEVKGRYLHIDKKQEQSFEAVLPKQAVDHIANTLVTQGIAVEFVLDDRSWILDVVIFGFPLLLVVSIGLFLVRRIRMAGTGSLAFGKSRAKLCLHRQKMTTFEDVAGIDEAKEELQEIVEFLKEPRKFQRLGGRIPKGFLLVGPPGTGKTLLARAIAGEAAVPFFSVSGSEFVELFVGIGASRVRDLFKEGKRHSPCIIFIDEIDAVGRRRGAGLGEGHDEREQTLNQLLSEMDGFESSEGIILIAATNRPDVLDPALLRPGRFDRQVVVPLPDIQGREGILRVHTRRIPLSEDVDIPLLARGTSGFSGAQLANLSNEAALHAASHNREAVTMVDLDESRDRILLGKERRSLVIAESDKLNRAYYEAGRALVACTLPEADPLHKVTIIPRGRALGRTVQLPREDLHNHTKEYVETSIAILLAGRCAEEIFLGNVTTGASDDLARVSKLALKMVGKWGMSEALGPLSFGQNAEPVFLAREVARPRRHGQETAAKIDREVRKIVLEGYQRATRILKAHSRTLVRLADALLEEETLDAARVEAVVQAG